MAPGYRVDPAPSSAGRRRLLGLIAGSVVLLAACGGSRPPGREEDAELQRFTGRGYEPSAMSFAEPYRDVWLRGGEEIGVSLLVPRGAAPSPLVIYLPGMSEPAEAGERWRRAWAQAGYAVASLQTGGGGSRGPSAAGRGADFSRMAREQFDAKTLADRIACVDFVLKEIARRAAAAQGVFAGIDTRRVAVAGFDLGAQTALALAGEKYPGMGAFAALPDLRAVIVLSPHARISGGFADRYAGIRLPVLSVTGSEDADPYGLVDSPHTRQAPYNYMPPGGKFLLVLEDGAHRQLAGAKGAMGDEQDMPGLRREGGMPGGSGEEGGPQAGRGRMGGRGGSMGGTRGGGPPGDPSGMGGSRRAGGGSQRQAVIVERVSLAFLDAFVKEDPVAGEWLARDAGRWMDSLARLEAK